MAARGHRHGENTERRAAGHVLWRIANPDNLAAGKPVSGMLQCALDRERRQAIAPLAVGTERAKGKMAMQIRRTQLEISAARDVPRKQGKAGLLRAFGQRVQQRRHAGVEFGSMRGLGELSLELTEIRAPK